MRTLASLLALLAVVSVSHVAEAQGVLKWTLGGQAASNYVMTADGNNQIALPMDKVGGLTPDWAPAQ